MTYNLGMRARGILKTSLYIALIYAGQALLATGSFALPEGFFSGKNLASVVIQAGCSAGNVEAREEFLRSPAGQLPDQLLYCKDSCGSAGCTYFIFLRNQEAFDLYRYAGSFTGHYTVLRSAHEDYHDLKVEQRMGAEKKLEQTLRCKSHRYH